MWLMPLKEAYMKCFLRKFAILLLLTVPAIGQEAATPTQQTAHHGVARRPSLSADDIWADLMRGNERFVEGKQRSSGSVSLRDTLAKGQSPHAVVLACSDSRVAPELVFDKNLGDLFVVRSAGNIAGPIGVGSIEYAVEHLGSTVLVVLGHTKCGAVTAACSGDKMPSSNLQEIVDKINPAVLEARKSNAKDDALVEAAIKENIHQSAKDVIANSEILRHFVEEKKLTVFEAEYQLDSGKVVRLDKGQQ
jgi:carbonic anhydrase